MLWKFSCCAEIKLWFLGCSACLLVAQLCWTLWPHGLCSPSGSSVHGISQARILEWVAISFSRRSSWSRDEAWLSCIGSRFFTFWAIREVFSFFFSGYSSLICQVEWQFRYIIIRYFQTTRICFSVVTILKR